VWVRVSKRRGRNGTIIKRSRRKIDIEMWFVLGTIFLLDLRMRAIVEIKTEKTKKKGAYLFTVANGSYVFVERASDVANRLLTKFAILQMKE
jgi:hypothetical protein